MISFLPLYLVSPSFFPKLWILVCPSSLICLLMLTFHPSICCLIGPLLRVCWLTLYSFCISEAFLLLIFFFLNFYLHLVVAAAVAGGKIWILPYIVSLIYLTSLITLVLMWWSWLKFCKFSLVVAFDVYLVSVCAQEPAFILTQPCLLLGQL